MAVPPLATPATRQASHRSALLAMNPIVSPLPAPAGSPLAGVSAS